jgi:hypothetical protein
VQSLNRIPLATLGRKVGLSGDRLYRSNWRSSYRYDLGYFTGNFSEGLAVAVRHGKYGFIDKDGNVVIDSVWDHAYSFSQGIAAVERGGKWGLINQKNEFVVQPECDYVRYGSWDKRQMSMRVSNLLDFCRGKTDPMEKRRLSSLIAQESKSGILFRRTQK